jgi:hypothetical protein
MSRPLCRRVNCRGRGRERRDLSVNVSFDPRRGYFTVGSESAGAGLRRNAMELDDLCHAVGELGVPAFMFQEGDDPTAEQAFRISTSEAKQRTELAELPGISGNCRIRIFLNPVSLALRIFRSHVSGSRPSRARAPTGAYGPSGQRQPKPSRDHLRSPCANYAAN